MSDLKYNFLNDDFFTVYENVKEPKVNIKLPLFDDPLDISDWATEVTEDGTPVIKDNRPQQYMIFNTPETTSYLLTTTFNRPILEIDSESGLPKYNFNQFKSAAMSYFLDKGLLPYQAAAVVGNLIAESRLNPYENTGDNGKAFGMALWWPDRKTRLLKLANEQGTDIRDFYTQLDFIWWELNNTHKSALQGLLSSSDIDDATKKFMLLYEKPGILYLEARKKAAKSCLQ